MRLEINRPIMSKKKKILFSICHATSVNGGAMIIASIISSYFAIFMTDNMRIPAMMGSFILFGATFIDAIFDPFMGIIADNTKTKWGKYRPYFIITPVILTVVSSLLWLNPDLNMIGKVIYVFILYTAYGIIVSAYTTPQFSILPAVIKENDVRNKILTLGAICVAISFTIGSSFTQPIVVF